MEFKAFKYSLDDFHKMPDDFNNIYYNPRGKRFASYACSLIVENDNIYRLEGPDSYLIKYIDNDIKRNGNKLPRSFNVKTKRGYALCEKRVTISDPKFIHAFDDCVARAAMSKDYYYTGSFLANENYQKVDSKEDVQKLDTEYAEWKKKEIARIKAEESKKEAENESSADL